MKSTVVGPICIVSVVAFCYLNSINNYFIGDTWGLFYRSIEHRDHFLSHFVFFRFTAHYCIYLLYKYFGLNPVPYHSLIIILHTLNTCLVFFFLIKIIQNYLIALIASLFFATFWMNSETVLWLTPIQDLLMGTFLITTLALYYYYRTKGNLLFYLASLVTFVAALLSKENALVLFPLLLLGDAYAYLTNPSVAFSERPKFYRGIARRFTPLVPFFLLTTAHIYITIYINPTFAGYISGTSPLITLVGFRDNLLYLFSTPIFIFIKVFPCADLFIKLTGLLWICLAGVVFIRLPRMHRHLVVLLFLGCALVAFSYGIRGVALRYAYFASIGSSVIMAITVYAVSQIMASYVSSRTEACERYAWVIFLSISAAVVLCNYGFIQANASYFKGQGEIARTYVDTVKRDLSKNKDIERIILVNFPIVVEPPTQPYFGLNRTTFLAPMLGVALRPTLFADKYPISISKVQTPVDFDYTWKYDLGGPHVEVQPISHEELDQLALSHEGKDHNNMRIYFMNPKTRIIEDITGHAAERLSSIP